MGRAEDLFHRIERDGEVAINDFIAERQSEELYLDFKRSSDNGSGKRLSDIDRNNLIKAISGFGNSEGGILVWGVDCSAAPDGADVAKAKIPLANAVRFLSWLEGAVSGCTVPPHPHIRHHSILVGQGPAGFVTTIIPQSNLAPHQTVGSMIYYMRAGSDFRRVPHGVLAGMFGRRPQPHVFQMFPVWPAKMDRDHISLQVGVKIHNEGPGIARDLFLNLSVNSVLGENCTLDFKRNSTAWTGDFSFGYKVALICPPDFRLPPGGDVQPLLMNFVFAPPFVTPLEIEGMVGSGSSPPYRFKLFNTAENAFNLFHEIQSGGKAGKLGETLLKSFGSRLLNTETTRQK